MRGVGRGQVEFAPRSVAGRLSFYSASIRPTQLNTARQCLITSRTYKCVHPILDRRLTLQLEMATTKPSGNNVNIFALLDEEPTPQQPKTQSKAVAAPVQTAPVVGKGKSSGESKGPKNSGSTPTGNYHSY